ncbi:MAG: hypothetical protein M3Z10_11510, partial [Gemmatimonadota bacterium]|nr:hypothetical protein [Gemmatimonadota bacterium]
HRSRLLLVVRGPLLPLVVVAALAVPNHARAQQASPIRRLEREIWTRITDRARGSHALTLERGPFDIALPIQGDPREVRGPAGHARDALAVASVRLEPVDTLVDAPDTPFTSGRYDLRIEDRVGHCVAIHQEVRLLADGSIERGARMEERCRPLFMAEVVRRGRRLVRLPLNAGQLTDHWSVASAIVGWVDVYADSAVVIASTLALKASYPTPDTLTQHVDSIAVGLALGDSSWSIERRSAAFPVRATLRPGAEWRQRNLRFAIPLDSAFALKESWPVVEVVLGVPRTEDNPIGRAWTYAHAAKSFFARTISK